MSFFFFFSSRRRHTRCYRDWSSDVCSSDLTRLARLTGPDDRDRQRIFGADGSADEQKRREVSDLPQERRVLRVKDRDKPGTGTLSPAQFDSHPSAGRVELAGKPLLEDG